MMGGEGSGAYLREGGLIQDLCYMKKERRKIHGKKGEMSISQRQKLQRLGNAVLDFGLNKRSPTLFPHC